MRPSGPSPGHASWLDLRIPPVALLLIAAILAFTLARRLPALDFELPGAHTIAGATALLGAAVAIAGVTAFRRHGTTVDPRAPGEAATIVSTGIYRYTRNPMYVGLAMLLTAGAIALKNLAALCVVPLFVLYLTAYQIRPEERLLLEKFGASYADYTMKVRRWL